MILNLTQHAATPDQIDAGVMEPVPKDKKRIISLLTFESLPSREEVIKVAKALCQIIQKYSDVTAVMIDGPGYLLTCLDPMIQLSGIPALYAFSIREYRWNLNPKNGVVKEVVYFRHAGFVNMSEYYMESKAKVSLQSGCQRKHKRNDRD